MAIPASFNPIRPNEKWVEVSKKLEIDKLDRRFASLLYNLETGEFADSKQAIVLEEGSKVIVDLERSYPGSKTALQMYRAQYHRSRLPSPVNGLEMDMSPSAAQPVSIRANTTNHSAASYDMTGWIGVSILVALVAAIIIFIWSYTEDNGIGVSLSHAILSFLGVGVVALIAVVIIRWYLSRQDAGRETS